MLLGTTFKRITTSLGFKPCCACNKRAAVLDDASRRGFIRGTMFLIAFAAANLKSTFAAQVGADATLLHALNFIRTVTTFATKMYTKNGVYPSRQAVLNEIAAQIERVNWRTLFHSEGDESLNGWIFDYNGTKDGFVAIISNKVAPTNIYEERDVLTQDQDGLIYHTVLADPTQPRAIDLAKAAEFPSAKLIKDSDRAANRSNRISLFLSPWSGSTSPLNGDVCIYNCEVTCRMDGFFTECKDQAPTDCCYFNCGVQPSCVWCAFCNQSFCCAWCRSCSGIMCGCPGH